MKIKQTISVKGCDMVFKDGFEPGVLAEQTLTFLIKDMVSTYEKTMLAQSIIDHENELLKTTIDIKTEVIE